MKFNPVTGYTLGKSETHGTILLRLLSTLAGPKLFLIAAVGFTGVWGWGQYQHSRAIAAEALQAQARTQVFHLENLNRTLTRAVAGIQDYEKSRESREAVSRGNIEKIGGVTSDSLDYFVPDVVLRILRGPPDYGDGRSWRSSEPTPLGIDAPAVD